jgi:hypothetical protein
VADDAERKDRKDRKDRKKIGWILCFVGEGATVPAI